MACKVQRARPRACAAFQGYLSSSVIDTWRGLVETSTSIPIEIARLRPTVFCEPGIYLSAELSAVKAFQSELYILQQRFCDLLVAVE